MTKLTKLEREHVIEIATSFTTAVREAAAPRCDTEQMSITMKKVPPRKPCQSETTTEATPMSENVPTKRKPLDSEQSNGDKDDTAQHNVIEAALKAWLEKHDRNTDIERNSPRVETVSSVDHVRSRAHANFATVWKEDADYVEAKRRLPKPSAITIDLSPEILDAMTAQLQTYTDATVRVSDAIDAHELTCTAYALRRHFEHSEVAESFERRWRILREGNSSSTRAVRRRIERLIANQARALHIRGGTRRYFKQFHTVSKLLPQMRHFDMRHLPPQVNFINLAKAHTHIKEMPAKSEGLPSDECWRRFAPSVDRIRSDGHYTRDNVQLTCVFANVGKAEADDDSFKRFLAGLAIDPTEQNSNAIEAAPLRPPKRKAATRGDDDDVVWDDDFRRDLEKEMLEGDDDDHFLWTGR
ncbi:hypothetical protein CYMTET_53867 [Cymbomonas tetramitiformis]|uniref:Uncharacterized protein n=1 Tax=Cymbomonas tetramitiformis TaxID=36881 RepID=A0AAE0BHA6_9CHLO|nr:hypothetical protein CYMTET_53867 [Cymbomonas tetramitiformis]